jgi:hypothetical protein
MMVHIVSPQIKPAGKLIYLGACFIAAVRLVKEAEITNSPRVVYSTGDWQVRAWRRHSEFRRSVGVGKALKVTVAYLPSYVLDSDQVAGY